MSLYEDLVTSTQNNFYRYQQYYRAGITPYEMTEKPHLSYQEQIKQFATMIADADAVLVGGASGLSAAGGGDFYYEDNASFRKYFGRFADKYKLAGAFSGSFKQWDTPNEKWAFMATFLNTTQSAEPRKPYLDIQAILEDKEDYFILTTNQDIQAVKVFPEERVAEIQGDHRYFQCHNQCSDFIWDAVEPVSQMFAYLEAHPHETALPTEMIPHCPNCGAEAFPWVRGYGNFLQGTRYAAEYKKVSDYIDAHADSKLLMIELGVGRMTPMFIQEPFWNLTGMFEKASYVGINDQTQFLPRAIEDKGLAIKEGIDRVLTDLRKEMGK